MQSFAIIWLGLFTISVGSTFAQALPDAKWTVDFEQSKNAEKRNIVSVIFTDNEHVAAVEPNWLAALAIQGSRIEKIGESDESAIFQKIYPFTVPLRRAAEGHIIVYRHELTFPQLVLVRQVDLPNEKISRDGSLRGFQNSSTGLLRDTGTWCVSLSPARSPCIASGTGRLLTVGKQGTIAETSTSVRVADLGGKPLGEVKMGKVCVSMGEFVSDGEFLLSDCKHARLMALDGKVRLKLAPLSPLSEVATSDNGTRLLTSRPTRHVSAFKTLGEGTVALLTLGVGVGDEANNRSLFTVIDTATGRQCFQRQIGFSDHFQPPKADLSPDGRKVVIGFHDQVQIFRVPDTCN